MISKQIQPYWYLQQLVDAEVRRLAPDAAVTPVVMYDDEKIQRHEDCPGVGPLVCALRFAGGGFIGAGAQAHPRCRNGSLAATLRSRRHLRDGSLATPSRNPDHLLSRLAEARIRPDSNRYFRSGGTSVISRAPRWKVT
jgi:hypothetical protein